MWADAVRTPLAQEDIDLLSQVAQQIAIAVDNALAYRQIGELKDKLAEEKLYLEEEIRTEYNFEEIIGESAALKRGAERSLKLWRRPIRRCSSKARPAQVRN